MKRIEKWQTSDGVEHVNKAEAARRQFRLLIDDWVTDGLICEGITTDLLDRIVKNWEEMILIVGALEDSK